MEFKRNVTVNAPADKVWEVLGPGFNDISNWASPVITSEPLPDLPAGSGRVCNVKGAGAVEETIYHYDDDNRKLAFILKGKKIPFFVKKIDNTWNVEPIDDNQSKVQVHANITLMPVFSQIISGMLSKAMSKQADGLLSELKDYVENDAQLLDNQPTSQIA